MCISHGCHNFAAKIQLIIYIHKFLKPDCTKHPLRCMKYYYFANKPRTDNVSTIFLLSYSCYCLIVKVTLAHAIITASSTNPRWVYFNHFTNLNNFRLFHNNKIIFYSDTNILIQIGAFL